MNLKFDNLTNVTRAIASPIEPKFCKIYILQLIDNTGEYYIALKASPAQIKKVICEIESRKKGIQTKLFLNETKRYRMGGLSLTIEECIESIQHYGDLKINKTEIMKIIRT